MSSVTVERFLSAMVLLPLLACSSGGTQADAGQASAPADAGSPSADASIAASEGAFGLFAVFTEEFADFSREMGFDGPEYRSWAGGQANVLGARWTRSNLQLVWDFVEPEKGEGFDWSVSFGGDAIFAAAAAHQVQYLAVFHEGGGQRGLRDPLSDLTGWARFAQAAVERYDGDGVDDAPGSIVIKHWQLGNEIPAWTDPGRSAEGYARWVEAAAEAIHAADPSGKVVLIASTGAAKLDPFYPDAIAALKARGVSFDAIDLHHWGRADVDSGTMKAVPALRAELDSAGFSNVEIWSCEHGTYVGTPLSAGAPCTPACPADKVCAGQMGCVAKCFSNATCPAAMPSCNLTTGLCGHPAQTQRDQARSVVYRYAVNRALGVRRILWNNLVAWHCFSGTCGSYFDLLGLVADGWSAGDTAADRGKPRLAYHTYRMLAARTDEGVAKVGKSLQSADPAVHAYEYEVLSTGRTALVAWADSQRQATLPWTAATARLTALITDPAGQPLREETLAVSGGGVSVALDQDPVWLE
ncbi:MAG: hypothetical protein HY901_08520 [Deltaproteobacteria bacterium]|nr:hypothetical protein [Deltaproteobacteria bacterium]